MVIRRKPEVQHKVVEGLLSALEYAAINGDAKSSIALSKYLLKVIEKVEDYPIYCRTKKGD